MNVLANQKIMTEAEKRLSSLLFDEGQQVLSTFEMNKIASLSYEHETCEQIFDMLEEVMGHPMKFTVLAVQKSLFVAQHVLIYGSEKCVNSCWGLSSYVEQLCKFNTVLLAQKQQGVGSWWQSVKGGGVDKGFPVREASEKLHVLLADAPRIQQLRNDHADPNSLVPVGSTDKVAFVSDEVRHYMLKKRMDEHALLHTRSNLVKSSGGFGSGYNSTNGQTVVGAAHSMEEMLKRAERETKKFSDSGPVHYKPKPPPQPVAAPKPAVPAAPIDLLDFTASAPALPVPEIDLLGFGGTAPAPAPAVIDIFAPAAPATNGGDLLGGDLLGATSASVSVSDASDFLSLMAVSTRTDITLMNGGGDTNGWNGSGLLDSGGLGAMPPPAIPESAPPIDAKPSVMASNVDRFAALDALSPPAPVMTKLSSIEAENRILGFTNSIPTLPSDVPPPLPTEAPPPLPTEAPPPPPSAGESFMGGAPIGGMGDGMMGDNPMGGTGDGMMGGATMGGMGNGIMGGAPMGGMGDVMGGAAMGGMSMMGGEAPMGGAPMGGMPSFGGMEAPPLPPPSEAPQLPPSDPPVMMPMYDDDAPLAGTTMGVGAKFGSPVDDEEDGFLMGGSSGAGLVPMGSMPSAPPPPPPPS